jgi:predicted dehydrogenase
MSQTPHTSYRFAVIGCGLIGKRRARSLPPGSVRWVSDLDLTRATDLADQLPGCEANNDPELVLHSPEIQAVIISTANSSLARLALTAVRAGKHVLVEKPAATSSAELRAVAEAATETGTLVRIGYNHRYHPAFLKLFELSRGPEHGEIMFVRARYGHGGRVGYEREWRADPRLSGGGELIDQGVHLIDLASAFLGEFTSVDGHAATYFWQMPVDDNAFLSLRNASGKMAWLHASCTEWKNLFCFEVYFEKTKFQVDGLGGSYGVERLTVYRMLPDMGPPDTTIYEFPRGDDSWSYETSLFLEDIETRRTPVPGLKEGIAILEAVEEIYRKSGFAS